MKRLPRMLTIVLLISLCASLLPAASADSSAWAAPGNSDLNILNGGKMAERGELFCSRSDFDGALYIAEGGAERMLVSEADGNLNISGDRLYYTLGSELRSVPLSGGESETLFDFGAELDQLYVFPDGEARFLSGGRVYSAALDGGKARLVSPLEGVRGLIPTEYGDVLLTGEVFDYDVYAGDTLALTGVSGCYTDSGYLALRMGADNYMVSLAGLFSGSFETEEFHIHGDVAAASLFDEDGHSCPVCDAEYYAVSLATEEEPVIPEEEEPLIPDVSQGQENMVKRARQLHEIAWTPLEDRYQWGYRGVFKAEETVTGLPYGQPVNNGGYVPWSVPLLDFVAAVNDNSSRFYTSYSTYNKIAPAHSCDCSAFVSYAWGLPNRVTTYHYASVAEKVSEQSIYAIQVGDALNSTYSHIVFVSAVRYNEEGVITSIDIMEQTPVKTKYTRYGEGGTRSLAQLQSYYFGGGYALYRKAERDEVQYFHSCAVPIDGDFCESCKAVAPLSHTTAFVGGKSVTLSHTDSSAVIYYTLDGSAPTSASMVYAGETLTFHDTTPLRAMAVTSQFSSGTELNYTVKVLPVETATASVASGMSFNDLIVSGGKVKLETKTAGATLYYTLDGSVPTESSAKYTDPITLTRDTTIKVMGTAPGCKAGAVAEISYRIGTAYTITATAGKGGGVSPSGATSVMQTDGRSYTITASAGYAIEDVKVDGVSVGPVGSYAFTDVSANHTIAASFKVVATHPFTDVGDADWFNAAVDYAYRVGLFNGTSATSFSPNTYMTRGMFITVLGRMAGVSSELRAGVGIVTGDGVNIREEPTTESDSLGRCARYTAVQILDKSGEWYHLNAKGVTGYIRGDYIKVYGDSYTDVPADMYYRPYIEWASLCGIATGSSAAAFSPEANITRQDMCVFMQNYITKYGLGLKDSVERTTFADDASIGEAAKAAVYALQGAGVISGVGDFTFAPAGSSSRAMVAQIFMNLANALTAS